MGVPLTDVFDALQAYLGGSYVNDFNRFGRTWQVIAQADGSFRDSVEDIANLRTRNDRGEMVPIGSMNRAAVRPVCEPDRRMRTPINSPAPSAARAYSGARFLEGASTIAI